MIAALPRAQIHGEVALYAVKEPWTGKCVHTAFMPILPREETGRRRWQEIGYQMECFGVMKSACLSPEELN